MIVIFIYLFIGQLLYDIGLSNLVQIYEKKINTYNILSFFEYRIYIEERIMMHITQDKSGHIIG